VGRQSPIVQDSTVELRAPKYFRYFEQVPGGVLGQRTEPSFQETLNTRICEGFICIWYFFDQQRKPLRGYN
jgi:hypothetical protein